MLSRKSHLKLMSGNGIVWTASEAASWSSVQHFSVSSNRYYTRAQDRNQFSFMWSHFPHEQSLYLSKHWNWFNPAAALLTYCVKRSCCRENKSIKEKGSCTAIFQRDFMVTTKLNQDINPILICTVCQQKLTHDTEPSLHFLAVWNANFIFIFSFEGSV